MSLRYACLDSSIKMASALNVSTFQWLVYHNLKSMYYYFKRAQAFLFVGLHNLSSECNAHFSATTTTALVLPVVLIWSLIHLLYRKVVDVFWRLMRLPLLYRLRLTESLWNAGFCIGCIPLCVTKLLNHRSQLVDILNIVTDNVYNAEETIPVHILFSCVIICAYYVHSVCLTYFQKGFDREFLTRGLLLLFLCTCYSLRYIRTGLCAVVLINVYSLNVEFMRICYSLNQSKVVRSGFLLNVTWLLLVIHYMLWGGVFLSTVPQTYLLSALNARVSDENLPSFVVLHAALWSYVSLEICNAPAMKLLYYWMCPNYGDEHRYWLDYALFQPYNDEIRYLRQLRRKARMGQTESLQHYPRKGRGPETGLESGKSSRALYQTVRCVMALKRRIRRKRAARASLSGTSDAPHTADSSGVQGNT